MKLLGIKSVFNKKNDIATESQETAKPVSLAPPDISLGISPRQVKPTEEIDELLLTRFSEKGLGKCDSCGVTINKEMRHSLHSRGNWYNVCSMCYYPTHLDKIPFFEEGHVICFPEMSQARLNAFMRGLWVVQFFANSDPNNKEMLDVADTLSDMERIFEHITKVTANFLKVPTETGILASTLFLLQEDEYAQKHKYFGSFRWMPPREIYEKEIVFWAQHDYSNLHHEQISSNITKFMEEYTPQFRIKE
jgi:hypothetical protein